MLNIYRKDNILYLSGDTYALKDYIKLWGGRWDPKFRSWKFIEMTFDELVAKLDRIDLLEFRVDKQLNCTYHGIHSHHMYKCPIIYNLNHDMRKNYVEIGCSCMENKTCLLCAGACCPKARKKECVCLLSIECSMHGKRCIGTHD